MRVAMLAAAAVCACWLSGCASVPREAGFPRVQELVRDRIGQRIAWNQSTAADAKVAESVKVMLTQELTVDDCVEIALLNNRALQAIYEELGVAQADLVEAGLLQNPVFIGQIRFPSRPEIPWEADVVQNFLDLFVLPLRKRMAEAGFERAKYQVASAVLDHAAHVRSAYYTLQGAEQLREMRATAAEATEASAELATRQFQASNISELDRSNEHALHEQAMIEFALSEGEVLTERERLNGLMGLWGEEADQWRIATRLPGLPEREVAFTDLETLALSQRLELQRARQEIEVTAQSLGLAQFTRAAGGITRLDVGGHYEREPEGIGTAGPSLVITLPIFNQGQPALARAEALLRQSQQRYNALAAQIHSEVRAARDRLFTARHLVDRYQTSTLPLRERIVQESQLHYNAMQIGPFQLLQARQAQLDAGRQYTETLRNYWVARSDLERAVGGRLITASTSTQPAVIEPQPPSEKHEHETQSRQHEGMRGHP